MAPMLLVSLLLATAVSASSPSQSGAAELFEQGITWKQFLDAADARRELWLTNAGRSEPAPELVNRARQAGAGLRILVIAEAACSDSVNTVPFIAALAERAGIDLRIIGRQAGLAVLERHRTPDGRAATPTIVLLRGTREIGAWVERPAALQAWFLSTDGQERTDRFDRKMSWYEWDRGDSTVAELVALIEQAADARR